MAVVGVEAQVRDKFGTKEARQYRRNDLVPGVFYMQGEDNKHLLFEYKGLTYFLRHAHGLVDLKLSGEKAERKCVLKDVQYDPVTDRVIHVDFLGVKMGENIQLSVPVVLKGIPEGVKEGGILQFLLREIEIECLPKNIPNHFEVDVSELVIGKAILLKDLTFENVTILTDPDEPVATVELAKAIISELDEAVTEEPEEPETIGEEENSEE